MSDKGRIVAVNADLCPLCAQTMRIFTAAYGAEAGVAGLKWLPYGGTAVLYFLLLESFVLGFITASG